MRSKKVKNLKPASIEDEQLNFREGSEPLVLRYVLVDELVLLEGNPKLHDNGRIAESIIENGFRDPPAWDSTLNGGAGGLVEGNGRAEVLKQMQDQGQTAPRGIAVSVDGHWCIPVLFGVDARSESAAKRYALDHNNLTMAGGSFTSLDMSRMYDMSLYMPYLEDLSSEGNLPLTVDSEDLALLIKIAGENGFDSDEYAEDGVPGANPFNRGEGSASEEVDDDDDDEKSTTELSDGSLIQLIDVTIDDPKIEVLPGDTWILVNPEAGDHILVVADVVTGWTEWKQYLQGENTLFAPYPGIFVALSKKANQFKIVMVQPDPYIAGHILDRYAEVNGVKSVQLKNRVKI